MAKNATVGSRELKTRLGRYLGRVRRGETLVITDRNEPIAELRPLDTAGDPTTRRLRKLAVEGTVTLATRASLEPIAPVRTRGLSASAAVLADRDDRG
jgi:prevent-host-death family protein